MSGAVAFAIAAAASGRPSEIVATAVVASDFDRTIATAGVRFKSDGTIQTINGSITFDFGAWVSPASSADEWEIRATLASGSVPTGTRGSWLPLTSTREWVLTRSSDGMYESDLTFEFRRVGDTDPEVTITTNLLQVEVISGGIA